MLTTLNHQLHDYYAAQFPERTGIVIQDLKQLASGWASDVYSFTLEYIEHGGLTSHERLILKAYSHNPDGMDRALKERHALFNLRAAKYPVPGVAAVEIKPDYLGRPFIIMEQVNGHLLWDEFQEADGQRRQELIQLFVGLLVDLHALGAEALVSNVNVTDYTLINREIHTMRGLITHHNLPEFAPVTDWLYERRQSVPCDKPVVTHRDYHPWNILLTENGRPFVIDWGWQLSDPRFDVAWTLTLMSRSGFQSFRDAVLVEYERVTGGQVEGLDYFEVVASLRWLLNVINSARSGADLRSNAQEEFRTFITEPARKASILIQQRTGITLPSVEELLQM
jgi:aminoglycoside phosphotransferase (APT) family kinase protein